MGGPTLLPSTVPPPKQKRSFPWTQAALPVPKPARTFSRRRGQGDPFGDIVAGVQNMIQNISQGPKYDLVLSSGFLAFAAHSGFLKAVEESKVPVASIVGTSSGAISGSLYAAGYSAEQVATELGRVAPIQLLRPNMQPWKGGVLTLDPVVERLRQLLPATFEELPVPLAVGVVDQSGKHILIRSGPLPEAVAASAAIPMIFSAVDIPGAATGPHVDGGKVDRTALKAWRDARREGLPWGKQPPRALVHLVERSSQMSGTDDVAATGEKKITVCRSPKSGANFFALSNFEEQVSAAYARAQPTIAAAKAQRETAPVASLMPLFAWMNAPQ
ncbi:hypothetical protein ABBQ32_005753 [Trebouxia sp. C0010 RCD-2024]